MNFQRMILEIWFDTHQYEIEYNLGESAIQYQTLKELGIDPGDPPLRYGYHKGDPGLRDTIAEQYPGFGQDNVAVTSGASEGIFSIMTGLLQPGDHVVIEYPNYASLYATPRALGCEVDLLTLRFEDRYVPDLERLESMIKPTTKLVALTHPSNPTGSTLTPDDLNRVVDLVDRHGIYLLFDELYRDFAFENPLPQAATLSPRVISLNSMSKIYGLPGLRVGWVASQDPAIADTVRTVREHLSICNAGISEVIAREVLERGHGHFANARALVERNRAIVGEWFRDHPYLEWVPPAVGINCFPRIKADLDLDPERFFEHLVRVHKTFVIPGSRFEYDARYFRLGFGCRTEELEGGLPRVDQAFEALAAANA
jgi:aspartate/methionine/tyrosine aminotransferase